MSIENKDGHYIGPNGKMLKVFSLKTDQIDVAKMVHEYTFIYQPLFVWETLKEQ
jgi:hypothetical protein